MVAANAVLIRVALFASCVGLLPTALAADEHPPVQADWSPAAAASIATGAPALARRELNPNVPGAQLVFVDSAVAESATLLSGLDAATEIVEIAAGQDGLLAIADALAGRSDVAALHIISHGQRGGIQLGGAWIDSAALDRRRDLLAAIGSSLADGADVLLYGCDVAAGEVGGVFVDRLATSTRADVAASDDRTGSLHSGGDWVLEAQAGEITTSIAFKASALSAYSGFLAVGNENFDGAGLITGVDVTSQAVGTWTFRASSAVDIAVVDGTEYPQSLLAGSGDRAFVWNLDLNDGSANVSNYSFESTDGTSFNLNSFSLASAAGGSTSVAVSGWRDGGEVVSSETVDLTTSDSGGNITFTHGGTNLNGSFGSLSFGAAFDNVDEIRLDFGSVAIVEIDDIDISPASVGPTIGSLNGDSVAWAGVGNAVTLDSGGNADLGDTDFEALNGGSGDWSGASLTVQRNGTAVSTDILGFDVSGALFSVSGGDLQFGSDTFATFTNSGGVLTINFTSSATPATTALVNDVAQRITYRSDTPAGDATVRFLLSDGTANTTADVTVTSDTIYVTNTTDTATINVSNGVSFSEAVAIAAADATGAQTIAFDGSLASTALTINSVSLDESLSFDMDAASGLSLTSGTITLGAATTQTFSNGTGDTATISGGIAGSGAFTKAGAGALALSATNTWSGATTVSAGTLTVSGGNAISTNSSVSVAAGATLALSNNETIGNLSGAGAVTLGSNTLTSSITADTTFSGGISGTGGLSVSQTGAATFALTLSGTNTYTGTTTALNFGWLKLNGDASVSSSSSLRANGNSIITLQSDQTVGSLFSNNAGASIQLGAFTLSAGGDNTSTTVSGVVSGTGSLVKQGSGTMTLAGTNTYSGTTTVSAGALSVTSDSNLGSNSVTLAADSTLEITGATFIDNAIALSGDASISNSADATLSGVISGASTLTKSGASTLTLSSTNTYVGTTVSAGALSVASDANLGSGAVNLAGGTLAITGATNIDNAVTLTGNATVSNSADATLSGVISGANSLGKSGAATLTLSGTNSYAGSTTIGAGTLSVASDANLGSGTVNLAAGSTLAITGATTIDNAVALTGNATVSSSANATLSGAISGGFNLAKTGAAALTLSGSNSYSGTTTVAAGALGIAGDGNLGGDALILAAGTTLAISGSTTIDNSLVLAGDATVQAASAVTWAGVISGSNTLAKTGAGTLTLSASNTATGTTTVSAGTLSVTGSTAGATTTASGGTLGGTGTLGGMVTVQNGGILSPGVSPGTLTVNGDLTMAAGSALAVEINGTTAGTQYDQIIVNGTVDVSGATLSATHGYASGSGDSYTIIVNDAADAVTGSFSGLAEGATIAAGGNGTVLTASYIGGTGNDFTLTAPANPTVTSVSSISGDSTYKVGDSIVLVVNFSEAVFLSTGTIQLMMETGTTDRAATYLAGSGSSSIYFSYTVQEGDISPNLDFTGTTALVANGDTIQSGSFIDANLTLPNPGDPGSIAASTDIVIDGVRPTAGIVVADTALAAGETSTVTITFNEAVSGLAVGDFTVANGALSGLSSGDGGITWTATLTPTTSVDDMTNLITLDNTGVADDAGNTGTGTTDSNNYAIDTLRPTASIVVADTALAAGETSTVTITFNEAVSGLDIVDFVAANGALSGLASGDGGITWTATLTPAASIEDTSNLITLDNTGVADAAGNTGTGTTDSNNYAIDSAAPTAGIVVADTALAADETSVVTITFSEAVSGLSTGDFTTANGALSGLSTGDGGMTWTATLTPTASIEEPTNLITLDNSGVLDAGGNPGAGTTDSNSYAIDTLRPTASLVVDDTALASGETSVVTITFNEAVSGLDVADFTAGNGTLSGLSSADGGITWTATLTPDTDVQATGNVVVLDDTGLTDAAGNTGPGTTDSNTYDIDSAGATATLVVADTALAAGESTTLTITFNEAVSDLTTADLTVANGLLAVLASVDGGTTWTATLTPAADIEDSSNLITLDNTGVMDASGNAGTGTTDSNNYAIDTLRPTAAVTVADTVLGNGEASAVTITFAEAISGLALADFTVQNGALSGLATADGGITWTATLTPAVGIDDSSSQIVLDNAGVADAAGNTGVGSTASNTYAIDTLGSTSTLVVADTSLAAGETSLVTISFSDAVSGFSSADLSVGNGSIAGLASSDGGITWTATLTPTAGIEAATNVITLDNTGVTDGAGNPGTGSTNSNVYAIDTQRPTASLLVADSALASGETSLLTITFSEAVSGFTIADLTVGDGSVAGLASGDGGVTWTATLTPAAGAESAGNVVTLDNAGVQDLASNAGAGSSDSNAYAIDTVAFSATLVVDDTALAIGETATVTVTFSEAVTGFAIDDLSVGNGSIAGLASSDGGITWTATLSPAADVEATGNVVTLDNTGVTDGAGNPGAGSTDSNAYAIDTQRPTASLLVADTALASGETSLLTITFSEAVTGFTIADLSVGNGSVAGLASSDGGITWTATLTPTAGAESTSNVVTLDNAGVQDLAGNAGTGSSDSNAYAIDTAAFSATLVVDDTTLAIGETATVTMTFSEAVTGFAIDDLSVGNGSVAGLASSDGGTTWTATLSPAADVEATGNVVTLDNTGVVDAGGNPGSGTTASNTYAVDTIRPLGNVQIVDTTLAVGETLDVVIDFSEPVVGFDSADITAANGSLGALTSTDGGITWNVEFTPTEGVESASNFIGIDNTGYTDAAGNTGTGTSGSVAFAIDTLRPQATLVLADSELIAGETSLLTITFSEAVTGFDDADLDVANGSLGAVASGDGGTTWTATFTPSDNVSATGNVIRLDNTGVTDAAGNAGIGTSDSNSYSVDTTSPTASLVVADTSLAIGDTTTLTITFSAAVSGLDAGDLDAANATLGTPASADGGVTWTATLAPADDVDDASNTVTLDSAGVTGIGGNPGSGSVASNNYIIDTRRPTATLAIADDELTHGETALLTITFSEAVTGFDNADLDVPNATLGTVASDDGGITWTATFTPASVVAPSNVITLANSGVADAAGNAGIGSSQSGSFAINTVLYTVGGTVAGLDGAASVVLQLNGGDDRTIVADGGFAFSAGLADDSAYAVTVLTQPSGQTCSVANGSGVIDAADVGNVAVTCASDSAVPGMPEGIVGTAGSAQIIVAWAAPTSDGGSPITGYVATATPVAGGDGSSCATTGATSCAITGLVNGVEYALSVTASNAEGSGLPGTGTATVTPFTEPAPPTNVQVAVSGASASISWTPPADDGGMPITGYTVTASPGGLSCTVTGDPPPTSCTITGLTPGVAYSFTVTATNAGGAVGDPGGVGAPAPTPQPVIIPSTSAWGLLLLALLAGAFGSGALRSARRRA